MKKFRMIHHVDRATIAAMYEQYAPVFILSTGRAGSKFIVELLNLDARVLACHEPRPTLEYFCDWASRHQERGDVLGRMIDAARMEMVLEACIRDRIFIESNQCLTFFAPALAALFKSAKFVHLARHPGDFVASAARKGWHRNDSIWESGRARLADERRWSAMDQVERLAWLWDFTNRYLRDFLASLPAARRMTCRLEDLLDGERAVKALFSFCGAAMPKAEKVTAVQVRPVNTLWVDADEPDNMKKNPAFPAFRDWPAGEREKVARACAATARGLDYEL